MVFLHAHPDDEAIFTGGTMARLADAGHRVVLVVATRGDRGEGAGLISGPALSRMRAGETRRAAELLGAVRTHFLPYADSGLSPGLPPPGSFAAAPTDEAATHLATILRDESADVLVAYDDHGIYAHPDHAKVYDVAAAALALTEMSVFYEATVDREYLHFVETHVVSEAALVAARLLAAPAGHLPASEVSAGRLGVAVGRVGLPTVEIDCTVDVRPVLDRKRAALAAHASQLPAGSAVMQLAEDTFAEVYGWEWFRRTGPAGPIDDLT